jgi:uncharacterized protein
MIATVDTNVLVSATLFGSVPGRIMDAAFDRRFTLALSPAILTEYQDLLSRSKFGLPLQAVEVLARDMESHALIVYPVKRHHIIMEDDDDNAIIDCAVEAKADLIVSGDSHLTSLRTIEGISVVTPPQFIESIY